MKNIAVAVPTNTCYLARVWAAKHMTSVSRIVGKTARQIAEQTSPVPLPLFFESGL